MRHLFFCVTAALALAGCAADRQDADSSSTASRATTAQQTLRTTALADSIQRLPIVVVRFQKLITTPFIDVGAWRWFHFPR